MRPGWTYNFKLWSRKRQYSALANVRGNWRKPMGFDRPEADDPEDISGSIGAKRHEQVRQPADGVFAEAVIADPRTQAEYYLALRAAVEQQTRAIDAGSASADTPPRSSWDNANPLTRPPLDALRVPPERAIHILDGDMTGGGHRHGAGRPGKTEFPSDWDDDKITDSILSVARSPDSASLQRNGRWKVEGVRDQVMLAVIITADGRIWTAYPQPGSPGVRQNLRTGYGRA